jgi:AAA ATPase domain
VAGGEALRHNLKRGASVARVAKPCSHSHSPRASVAGGARFTTNGWGSIDDSAHVGIGWLNGQNTMLQTWTVSNFKSIRESTTLDLGPLTVIAGPNNSGKSSLLQSILLLAQTIRAPASPRSLILNGDFVKLGDLDDALHEGKGMLSLAFTMRPQQRHHGRLVDGPTGPGTERSMRAIGRPNIDRISFASRFSRSTAGGSQHRREPVLRSATWRLIAAT